MFFLGLHILSWLFGISAINSSAWVKGVDQVLLPGIASLKREAIMAAWTQQKHVQSLCWTKSMGILDE